MSDNKCKAANIIEGKDWTIIEDINHKSKNIKNKIQSKEIELKLSNKRDLFVNLGLGRVKDDSSNPYITKGYVGITRLKDDKNQNIICSENNKEYILYIKPRFDYLNPVKIIDELKNDEEFIKYLSSDKKYDIDDIEDNTLIHFFENEPPININGTYLQETNIISAILFINVLTNLCKRSLMGKMQNYEENLTGKVKGKILFNKNIKHNISQGRNDRVYCKYQVYSIDILENQILKYGLYKAKKFVNETFKDLSGSIKQNIAYCEKNLENVTFRKISIGEIKRTKVSGFYANYKPALQFAKMLIEGVSIDADGNLDTEGYVTPYAINMQKLFEFYVRKILKDEIKEKYSDKIELDTYDKKFKVLKNRDSNHIQKNIIPDIVLKYKYNKVEEYIILDVKYKDYNKYSRDDTLQILAYGMLFNCKHIGLVLPIIDEQKKLKSEINIVDCTDKKYYHEILISGEEKADIINKILYEK